jgi:hypothetical protein
MCDRTAPDGRYLVQISVGYEAYGVPFDFTVFIGKHAIADAHIASVLRFDHSRQYFAAWRTWQSKAKHQTGIVVHQRQMVAR